MVRSKPVEWSGDCGDASSADQRYNRLDQKNADGG